MSGHIEKFVDGSYTHTLKIPDSWVFVELYEAINIIGGSQPPKSEFHSDFKDGLIRLIQIRDYKSDAHKVYIPLEKAKRFVSPDDVMIGRYGPPIFQILRGLEGAYNVALMKAVPIQGVLDNKYLFHFLNNRDIYNYVDSASDRTAGQSGVNKSHLEKYPLGIPPLAEQKVIADKLDELLAQVESTKARLDAIPAILKSFRQSVLAAAVSGKLTEEWREINELSSSIDYSVLAKEERKLKGFKETKNGKQAVVESEPFIIPYNWQWLRLGHIALKITDGAHNTPQVTAQGYPYLMAKNLTGGHLDFSENKCISEKEHRELFLKCLPEIGDLLVVNIGAGTGNNVLIDVEFEFSFKNIAIIKKPSFVIAEYLKHFFDAQKQRIFDEQTRGGAQPFLSLTVLNDIPFALPSVNEQHEIVRRVEELFAFADKVETQVNAAQLRVNNLTQSILAKAFRGELTADWRAANPELISGDNSAEALLKRIQAEREALTKTTKKPAKKA
jgi:type I restriction enzyme S subunit